MKKVKKKVKKKQNKRIRRDLDRRQGVNAGQYSAVRPKCDDEVYGTKFKKKATSISLQPSSKERD